MASAYACATFFFGASPGNLVEGYEELVEPANGYLTNLESCWALTDAIASETGDWVRQTELAVMLTSEDEVALSIFLVGEHWAMAVAANGQPGPVVAFAADDPDLEQYLPQRLLNIEKALDVLFPELIDAEEVDALFGALIDQAVHPDEVFSSILAMLGVAADWQRWCWYETIPEQLILDPDFSDRVIPLGHAKDLWEE